MASHPFSQMFSECAFACPDTVMVESGSINPETRVLRLVLNETPPDVELFKAALTETYGVADVDIVIQEAVQAQPERVANAPESRHIDAAEARSEPAAAAVSAPAEAEAPVLSRRERMIAELTRPSVRKSDSTTLLGSKGSSSKYIAISDLKTGDQKQLVKGHVINTNHRERTQRGSCVVNFDIADMAGAVRVTKVMKPEEGAPLIKAIKKNVYLEVRGKFAFNEFEGDAIIEPDYIAVATAPSMREDRAETKRVELHLHTQMSAMDATIPPADAVRRAAQWGHRAVAITDHGNVQAFPEVMAAADRINAGRENDKKIKVIYGTECYFVNDIERVRSVYGDDDAPLDGEFVAFDIETTGLSADRDAIIEIGAVLMRGGIAVDTFSTFVYPNRRIPQKITELTGIDDSMVAGAPHIETAVQAFLDFAGDRVLAAHNAAFDIGFISVATKRLGIDFNPTYICTRNMARGLLKNVSNFRLETVQKELKIHDFNHHRALDDAGVVREILDNFIATLMQAGVRKISEINGHLASNLAEGAARGGSNHMILLVKNETGLRNLYELISLSGLKYFYRHPLIPKSELDKRREGLLVGSACEAGELFSAIVARKPEEELLRIAEYYDFFEIQPIANNDFLIRNGKAGDEEELREWGSTVVRIAEKLGRPFVATGDVHFMEPEDERYRRVLMSDYDDGDNQAPLYFRTTDEMLREFEYLGDKRALAAVVGNPNAIADMCDDVRPIRNGTFSPIIKNSAEDLKRLVSEKIERLYGDSPLPEIMERVDKEMNAIIGNDFDGIYMIAQKLVAKSMSDGYLVGSRGSVGSSVVAYFADITEVNALPPHYRCPACKHHELSDEAASGPDLPDKDCPVCGVPYEKDGFDILFETFLGFDGDKKPDIDLNFSGEYQARAHEFTVELFGEGHVFRSGTIGTLAEKNAIGYVKKYAEKRDMILSKAETYRLAAGIIGVKKTTGQHPGGLIIVPEGHNINEFTPIQRPADKANSGIITTHFDYHSIEENLLKLDELGHDDPTMIRMLQELTGVDPQRIPLDDKDTMSIFTSTDVLGYSGDQIIGGHGTLAVPEFGTAFVRGMLADTEPATFDELIRISGLSHGTDVWLGNAKDYIAKNVATLGEVIGARDDITLFLTQCGIAPKLSFTISESVRKGKGLTAQWEKEMVARGVPRWYIDSCKKVKYLFPKAHAAAYVLMAFRIAWFKVHKPLAFYCAYFTVRAKLFEAREMTGGLKATKALITGLRKKPDLTAREEDMLTTLEVVYEFYLRGFDFEPIDLYRSDDQKFLITGEKTILPPFTSIGGLGDIAARGIITEREKGEFISAEDLTRRCPKVTKSVVEMLSQSGVLGGLPESNQVSLF